MEIKLSDLLLLLKKKLWLLIAVIFVCGAAALLISVFIIPPRYEATTTILVNPRRTADPSLISVSNLNSTTNLLANQVMSETFLTEVKRSLSDKNQGEFTETELRKMLRTERRDQSYTFSVIVNSGSYDTAYNIAKVIEQLLLSPDSVIIQSVAYEFKDHTPPDLDTSPASPNIVLNTVLGVFIGAVLGVLLVLLLDRLDVTVKSEESLTERYNSAILGVIYEHKQQVARGTNDDKKTV